MLSDFAISPHDLWSMIGAGSQPAVIDVRRRDVFESAAGLLPTAEWRESATVMQWARELDRTRPVVLSCKQGKELSQAPAAYLRSEGFEARVLDGGYAAWIESGLPLIDKLTIDRLLPHRPSVWVTRRRPKIDRVACPWLIQRFVDARARFLYVDPAFVVAVAQETGAIAFDIENVEISHDGPLCSFDTLLRLFGLTQQHDLARLALIVRGADTARPDLAAEAAGLYAVSLGLSALTGDDDHAMLRHGFMVYDALFAWLRSAADERHNWPAKAA